MISTFSKERLWHPASQYLDCVLLAGSAGLRWRTAKACRLAVAHCKARGVGGVHRAVWQTATGLPGRLPQVRLPPEGVPAPLARASAAVAGGSPVVETLASTSLWAVATLKTLSQVSMHHVCSGFNAHRERHACIRS